ncbi:MAG: hypothetical protein H6996_00200 [Moraxellaceae bacterium]|nr:hypothetical protein [Pseudomonadales bacterium]MCP5173506.1 hypothetical protein [Moraxellaceae bacterium]HQV22750.1 outer membrane protein assembly factor BamC [Agitococcus sp.]
MRQCLLLVAIIAVSACSFFPNRSLDYLQAQTLPPLNASPEQRVTKPLYAIPEVITPKEQAAVVVIGEGRKAEFVVPAPKVVLPNIESDALIPTVVSKPQMVFDGNNTPLLHTAGNPLQVWEQLGLAIKGANLTLIDRNQSLGLYYLELTQDKTKTTYLLKLSQTSQNQVVSVQKDADTLAESKLSQQILLSLIKHWPS